MGLHSLPKYPVYRIHNEKESSFMEESIGLQISGRGRIITRNGSVVVDLLLIVAL